jgi:undecaprenyl-diphosphatase
MWRIDHGLMRRVHRWPAPRWIRLWMLASTRAGDGWIWAALALAILLSRDDQRFAAVCAGTASAAVSVLLFLLLKRVFNRRRPCELETHCWATLTPPDEYSFPSGHTMVAFAVMVPLALFYPYLLYTLLFCALSIAASRIVLGMHFLTDVIAGAALGGLIGLWSYLVFY